jgi:small subunit ribosomal protein S19
MTRSIKKGVFVDRDFLQSIPKTHTWSRRSHIIPEMVGSSIKVHNGKTFVNLQIYSNMVGRKLGEFARTRKGTKQWRKK